MHYDLPLIEIFFEITRVEIIRWVSKPLIDTRHIYKYSSHIPRRENLSIDISVDFHIIECGTKTRVCEAVYEVVCD